jgi:hypothetical protein
MILSFRFVDGYQCRILLLGDIIYLQGQYWPVTVFLVTNGISATIGQSFLIFRYWMMSVTSVFISRSAVQRRL